MSGMALTLLRRTIIEALRPSALLGSPASLPTLARQNVFDSRLEPIDDIAPTDRVPCIVVYTESDEQKKIAQGGPQLYAGYVDLVFELSFVAMAPTNDPNVFEATYPVTDAQLESALDTLREQVWQILHAAPSGALFRKMVKLPADEWRAHRQASTEENARIAFRTIKARFCLREYCYEAAPYQAQTGLDQLPPALAAIAKALPADSEGAKIMTGVADFAPRMPIATPLNTVGWTIYAGTDLTKTMVDVIAEVKSRVAMPTVLANSATVHIDYNDGDFQLLVLSANVTSVVVDNWPQAGRVGRLILDVLQTGGFTLAGLATAWSDGTAYAASSGANKRDRVVLLTTDGGQSVDGNVVGLDYH
jgi:hypothetical protein